MTLLEAVNRVLIRLREDAVNNWNDNSYSRLIARLVNDAKREVEDAHPWGSLHTLIDRTVNAGAVDAEFPDTNKRTRILRLYNDTEDTHLHRKPRDWIIRRREEGSDQTARPDFWAFKRHKANERIQIELWPTVDATYTLTMDCILPQGDIVSNNKEITIPDEAVYLRATALALAERGDDQGQNFAQLMNEYQIALNDAVSYDKDNTALDDSWVTP